MQPLTKGRITPYWIALAFALGGLAPGGARAQSAADKWQWEVGIYGWLPAISGSTEFPSGASGPSLGVSMRDVLDSLKMTFMGQLQAHNGQWGFLTDVVYADLGATKGNSYDLTVDGAPITASTKLSLDVKSTVWTLAGLYRLASMPENTTDLVFGARMLHLKQTLDWSLSTDIPELPTRSGQSDASGTNWDAIVGLKGRYYVGPERRWFLPYYADVGGGQSKLTWQVSAGIAYKFDWGAVFATWRYLDYDFKSGTALQSMTMNGALLGVAFQF